MLLMCALLSTATGLRLFVGSARPAAVRSCAARMALPKIEDARSLSTEEIEAEIETAKKVSESVGWAGTRVFPAPAP